MLDKSCAYYMHMGVSYDDYWNGDYTMLKYKAEEYQIAKEARNEELWLQGLYFYDAFNVVMHNAFSKGEKKQYIDKPIRITPMTEVEKENESKQVLESFRAQLQTLTGRLEKREERRKTSGS